MSLVLLLLFLLLLKMNQYRFEYNLLKMMEMDQLFKFEYPLNPLPLHQLNHNGSSVTVKGPASKVTSVPISEPLKLDGLTLVSVTVILN